MRLIPLILLPALIAGCVHQQKPQRPLPEQGEETRVLQKDPAVKKLEQAADSIQLDLEKLSKLKQMGYEKVELYEKPESGPLAKKITLKWSGPLKPVLKVIADRIGFTFRVRGEPPVRPVLVNIDETGKAAFSVLEDLGWKAGKHQISVSSREKVVQLTYFEEKKRGDSDEDA